MCKIWISWISTTDFSRVIVGYLGRIPGGQLHNVLAVLRGEKPLGAAGGIAVGVVDRLLLGTRVPGAAALKLWPMLAAWVAGSLSGSWQSSLETWLERWQRLDLRCEGGHLQIRVDVHTVWQLLMMGDCRLVLQIQIAAAAPAGVQRVVDVVVVDAVVGVVQAVDGGHHLLAGMAALATQLTLLARGEGWERLGTGDCLVKIARLESSTHGDVSVEGEVNWFRKEITEFIPEPRVAPLHQRRVVHQVFQVWEVVHLGLAHLLQLDEDHLAVVGHDGGDEGRPDLTPLGGEIGPAKDDQGPS